jgi:hypothetical protein
VAALLCNVALVARALVERSAPVKTVGEASAATPSAPSDFMARTVTLLVCQDGNNE